MYSQFSGLPRRLPHAKRRSVSEILDYMLIEDLIEESTSVLSSSVVMVIKKDGSTQFLIPVVDLTNEENLSRTLAK